MNLRWKENPELVQILLGIALLLFLLLLAYALGFIRPSVSALDLFSRANSTRTSIALTSDALLAPFPTATGPSPTASHTPSITPTPTNTPTATPSPTLFRYFIDTGTPRTLVPGYDLTFPASTPMPTSVVPTRTSLPPQQPTDPPQQPTNPPQQPTNPPQQPTNPPQQPTNNPPPHPTRRPTKTPKPPKPTKTPRHLPITACLDPQSCSYFMSEKVYYRISGLSYSASLRSFWLER